MAHAAMGVRNSGSKANAKLAKAAFPCSLCTSHFQNARDLGTHILAAHCDDNEEADVAATPNSPVKADSKRKRKIKAPTSAPSPLLLSSKPPNTSALVKTLDNWSTVMNSEPTPIPAAVMAIQTPAAIVPSPVGVTTLTLPRPPTTEEQRVKFMTLQMSDATNRYICLVCNKTYTSRYNIRMHINGHTGKNVHACPFCGRCFPHRHVFESHVRTHTGERPFACQKCGRSFGDRSNCTSHQKKCKSMPLPPKINVASLVTNNNRPPTSGKKINGAVHNDDKCNSDDDDNEFNPQIVSVQSIGNGTKAKSAKENFDYDDIVDDSLYDEDLEEIQIEPDIIDYDDMEQLPPASDHSNDDQDMGEGDAADDSFESELLCLPCSLHCSFCGMEFEEQELLLSHLRGHAGVPKQAPTEADLERGFLVFGRASRHKHMCLSCGKIFTKEQQVKIHLNVHFGENIYKCRFCDSIFADFSIFERHMKSHQEEPRFLCKHCNAPFSSRSGVTQHQRICPMNFDERPSSEDKRRPHRSRQPPARFRTDKQKAIEAAAANSKVQANPKLSSAAANASLPCDTDDHYVPDNNSKNVMNKDLLEPPPTASERKQGFCQRKVRGQPRYVCTVCVKHYTTMYNMRQHRNVHIGSNLHTCRFCGKEFTHKHVWETHERIHTGERPFVCHICNKNFADRSNYNSHRKLCESTRKIK